MVIILGLGENFGLGRKFWVCICICILHFAFAFCICILHVTFAFEFPAKNSEFFRFKYLNFPPKNLDSIAEEEGEGGHGDNIGTSSLAFSVKPINDKIIN